MMMNVLILGANGMLGYSLFSNLSECDEYNVYGTVRTLSGVEQYFSTLQSNIVENVDVTDLSQLESVITNLQPAVVINCIGIIKQHSISKQHVDAITINALLPHRLAELCDKYQAKLIHFSTDCVFDGKVGNYHESDLPTATDLYGRSKCLGEVNYGNHLTLRTSIIGHELKSSVSLIDWFLSQSGTVNGFSKAIFSGLPTCYIAKLLAENILPDKSLAGLYHLSVNPIDKYTLISLVSDIYNHDVTINKTDDFIIDRSLDSTRIRNQIGFIVPDWNELISYMNSDYNKRYKA